jgi:hypothetical protein
MRGSSTTPGRLGARDDASVRCAFRIETAWAPGLVFLRLNPWPTPSLPTLRRRPRGHKARVGADVVRSATTDARSGHRMMPTPPRLSYHSIRPVFPSRLEGWPSDGPSQDILRLRLATGMRWSVSGLRPSFVRLVTQQWHRSESGLWARLRTAIRRILRHPRGPRSGPDVPVHAREVLSVL